MTEGTRNRNLAVLLAGVLAHRRQAAHSRRYARRPVAVLAHRHPNRAQMLRDFTPSLPPRPAPPPGEEGVELEGGAVAGVSGLAELVEAAEVFVRQTARHGQRDQLQLADVPCHPHPPERQPRTRHPPIRRIGNLTSPRHARRGCRCGG
eukprot:3938159-Rhodomonas_salina.3